MEKEENGHVKSDITISGLQSQTNFCSTCPFSKYKTGENSPSLPFRLYAELDCLKVHKFRRISKRPMTRGPYRKYTQDEKRSAVEEINRGYDVKYVAHKFGIPRRNLLRWRKNGCVRKEGGGRPTDMQMENQLCDKIKNYEILDEMEIRTAAKKLSRVQGFKGSRSWFVKFMKRHNLCKRQTQLFD